MNQTKLASLHLAQRLKSTITPQEQDEASKMLAYWPSAVTKLEDRLTKTEAAAIKESAEKAELTLNKQQLERQHAMQAALNAEARTLLANIPYKDMIDLLQRTCEGLEAYRGTAPWTEADEEHIAEIQKVLSRCKVGAFNEATMFWDAENPETNSDSIHDLLVDISGWKDVKVGDKVYVQRAIALPDETITITKVPDAEGEGGYDWTSEISTKLTVEAKVNQIMTGLKVYDGDLEFTDEAGNHIHLSPCETGEGCDWYIQVTNSGGFKNYDGNFKAETLREAVVEAVKGAMLAEG